MRKAKRNTWFSLLLILSLLFSMAFQGGAAVFALDAPAPNATITITADDKYTLWVNGVLMGSSSQDAPTDTRGWSYIDQYEVSLTGDYVVAVMGEDKFKTIAGMSAVIDFYDNTLNSDIITQSSSQWKQSTTEYSDWNQPGFDSSSWDNVTDVPAHSNWYSGRSWVWSSSYMPVTPSVSELTSESSEASVLTEMDSQTEAPWPFDKIVYFRFDGTYETPVKHPVTLELEKKIVSLVSNEEVPVTNQSDKNFVVDIISRQVASGAFSGQYTLNTGDSGNAVIGPQNFEDLDTSFYAVNEAIANNSTNMPVPFNLLRYEIEYFYGDSSMGPYTLTQNDDGSADFSLLNNLNDANSVSSDEVSYPDRVKVTVINAYTPPTVPESPPTPEVPTTNPEPFRDRADPAGSFIPAEPVPLAAPVIIAAPVAEEPVIFEEVIPLGVPVLPKTGEVPVELFYGLGGLFTAMGAFLKRK